MSDKERVIKAILNAMDCDFGFACAVPGNWGIPESIVFKEESGLLRFINHLSIFGKTIRVTLPTGKVKYHIGNN